MTRKTGQRSEVTRARLLKSATAEFARSGFQKASLRAICADADVTTGALYFFFKNKEDLFGEVIAPVEKVLGQLVEGLSEEGFPIKVDDEGDVPTGIDKGLEELFENRDAVTVVLNNRDVPAVAEFFDRAVGMAEMQVSAAFRASNDEGDDHDPFLVHWYAHLQVEMLLHTIEHSSTVDEAEGHLEKMARFVQGGISALAGNRES